MLEKENGYRTGGDKIAKLTSEYNFASHYPELLEEWDYKKNTKLPSEYTPSSGKSVWWICSICEHNWKAKIDNRIKPRGCPNCAGKKPHSDGHNSLFSLKPKLVLDWYDERSPKEFRTGSSYRARWKCHKCEHIWRTPIEKRALRDRGCLSCTRQQVHSSGKDSVMVEHPELMDEWNDQRDPATFLSGSSKKVNWKCRICDNEWSMSVKQRTPGKQGNQGCSYCNGFGGIRPRGVHSDGRNSMRRTDNENAKLMTKEFHPTLNGKFNPDNLTAGTSKKLWWICSQDCEFVTGAKCENVWQNTGMHRLDGQMCPVHGGGGLHSDGRNSLNKLRPELIEEWDFQKNGNLSPDSVTISSGKYAHWICNTCGNKWKSIIASRSKGHGCSACKKKSQRKLFEVVKKLFPNVECKFDYKHPDLVFDNSNARMELDIWVPELSIAFEYQGFQHFESVSFWGGDVAFEKLRARDQEKKATCEEKGIHLIEIDNSWDGKTSSIKDILLELGFNFQS